MDFVRVWRGTGKQDRKPAKAAESPSSSPEALVICAASRTQRAYAVNHNRNTGGNCPALPSKLAREYYPVHPNLTAHVLIAHLCNTGGERWNRSTARGRKGLAIYCAAICGRGPDA